jgi:hypothetical protein
MMADQDSIARETKMSPVMLARIADSVAATN